MLVVKIRSEEGIKGIVVDKEIKLAAFADDLTTFLHDVKSLENLSVILHRFGMCSGLNLNAETNPLSLVLTNLINLLKFLAFILLMI